MGATFESAEIYVLTLNLMFQCLSFHVHSHVIPYFSLLLVIFILLLSSLVIITQYLFMYYIGFYVHNKIHIHVHYTRFHFFFPSCLDTDS